MDRNRFPSSSEIETVNEAIRAAEFPRIAHLADLIFRLSYKLKKDIDWLSLQLLCHMITRTDGVTSPSELGRLMLRSSIAMTKIIDKLERHKLIARVRDSADRRIVTVKVTTAGLEYVTSALRYLGGFERKLRSELDERELSVMRGMLRKLRVLAVDEFQGYIQNSENGRKLEASSKSSI